MHALVEVSFIPEEDKGRILALYQKKGEKEAMRAFDEAAAAELASRVSQCKKKMDAVDQAVAELAERQQGIQDALEKELIAELADLPQGHSRERDAAWDNYYQKCDTAHAAHARVVRETMGKIVGLAGI